jgi:hypothetical protein
VAALCAATLAIPAFGQEKKSEAKDASATPNPEDMAKMVALAQPNENHKLLGFEAGNWSYKLKFWMSPAAPPSESTGTTICKPVMDGRYYIADITGKFQMPGPDGQMASVDFKGMETDSYDNVKKKFVSTWIDNMGTAIVVSEGTYDPDTKTFTYHTEEEYLPGVKTKVREEIKLIDPNHYMLDWYEDRGGQEVKTMEISYTRQG